MIQEIGAIHDLRNWYEFMKVPSTNHFVVIVAAIIFVFCIIMATIVEMPTTVAILVVLGGVLVSAMIVMSPALQKFAGKIWVSPDGVHLELKASKWDVRNDQPIHTVFPERPTDSTDNQEAIKLANEGRNLIKKKTVDHEVDLVAALKKFKQAALLDDRYWEPRINIAQILLLTGQIKDAFAESEAVRVAFRRVPLAYAKAGLIMARVMEQRISEKDSDDKRHANYTQIANLLKDNMERCPGHLTTMTSLSRVLLLAGTDATEMRTFLKNMFQYPGFVTEFKRTLEQEELLAKFNLEFPGLFEDELATKDDNAAISDSTGDQRIGTPRTY